MKDAADDAPAAPPGEILAFVHFRCARRWHAHAPPFTVCGEARMKQTGRLESDCTGCGYEYYAFGIIWLWNICFE